MIVQTLTVIPHGLIESGQVVLKIDQNTGIIDASESIICGMLFITETKAGSQVLKIDPTLLLSANIKPGMTWTIQNVTITIEEGNGFATVSYTNGADSMTGTADLDLRGVYVEIGHVNLSGTIGGHDIQLELDAASS